MLPLLTVIGDALGILGGLFIAVAQLQLPAGFYWNDVLDALTLGDLASGIGKSVFFAFFVTIIACYNGLTAQGGADGVGRATTQHRGAGGDHRADLRLLPDQAVLYPW